MRKFFLSVFLLVSILLQAQELTVTVDQHGKMGYSDASGAVVIKPTYDYAEPFGTNGFAKVGKGNKYGFIDKGGKLVLQIVYDEIFPLNQGPLVRVKKGGKYGLIDPQTLTVVLDAKYSFISKYNRYGLAWLALGGKMSDTGLTGGKKGVVNKDGYVAISPQYGVLKELSENAGKTSWDSSVTTDSWISRKPWRDFSTEDDTLQTDCKWMLVSNKSYSLKYGLIGSDGQLVLPIKYYNIGVPSEGLVACAVLEKSKIVYSYYNLDTKEERTIDGALMIDDFQGNITVLQKETGKSLVDRQFNTVCEPFTQVKYVHDSDSGKGYFIGISADEKTSAIYSNDGKRLLAGVPFSDANIPTVNYGDSKNIPIKSGGKWGLYSLDGANLIKPTYDYLCPSRYGVYLMKKDGKWGAVDAKGRELIPPRYVGIIYPKKGDTNNIWVQTPGDSLYHNYDIPKRQMLPQTFVDISAFEDGMAWASPSKDGKTLVAEHPGYGYIIDKGNNRLATHDFPYSKFEAAKEELLKNGCKPLSKDREHKFFLRLLRDQKRNPLDNVLSDTEWDF